MRFSWPPSEIVLGLYLCGGFPGGTNGKNPLANTGDSRDAGSIPGPGRSLEEETATPSRILAWEILWTEEPTVHRVKKSWTRLRD